jgi:hypothetical protein
MALSYFHLRNRHDALLDPEGRELASLGSIAAAALPEARQIISHGAKDERIKLSYYLHV